MRHIKSRYELLRQKVYIIIYGSSTVAGRTFDLLLLGVILLSLVLIMMASITRFDNQYHTFFIVSEWIITIFFSIEYILRIISNKKPRSEEHTSELQSRPHLVCRLLLEKKKKIKKKK